MRLTSEAKGFVSDKQSFVGTIGIEVEVTDAQTGKLLAVSLDKRVGGKTLGKGWHKWSDVMNAIDYWPNQMRYRLCLQQNRTGCIRPKG